MSVQNCVKGNPAHFLIFSVMQGMTEKFGIVANVIICLSARWIILKPILLKQHSKLETATKPFSQLEFYFASGLAPKIASDDLSKTLSSFRGY